MTNYLPNFQLESQQSLAIPPLKMLQNTVQSPSSLIDNLPVKRAAGMMKGKFSVVQVCTADPNSKCFLI
jgi:hypothetical protein